MAAVSTSRIRARAVPANRQVHPEIQLLKFVLACAIASLLLVAIGAVQAMLAVKKTRARVEQTSARVEALNLAKGEIYGDRINAAIAAMPMLVERANASVANMNNSMNELKLPEAIASLRNAAAAVKLLVSGR